MYKCVQPVVESGRESGLSVSHSENSDPVERVVRTAQHLQHYYNSINN